jgi:hypothetical protein
MQQTTTHKIASVALTVVLATAAIAGVSYALKGALNQSESPEKTTEKFFAEWIASKQNPLFAKAYQNNPYLTKQMEDEITNIVASFDKGGYDPILCAQDKPSSMSYTLLEQKNNKAFVEAKQDFYGTEKKIKIKLIKNKSGWQIDNIDCGNEKSDQVDRETIRLVGNYIRDNISSLSPEKEVLGGNFYVTEIEFISENKAKVSYEDGHNAFTADTEFELKNDQVNIKDFDIITKNQELYSK